VRKVHNPDLDPGIPVSIKPCPEKSIAIMIVIEKSIRINQTLIFVFQSRFD